jgi:hypothetical protein
MIGNNPHHDDHGDESLLDHNPAKIDGPFQAAFV